MRMMYRRVSCKITQTFVRYYSCAVPHCMICTHLQFYLCDLLAGQARITQATFVRELCGVLVYGLPVICINLEVRFALTLRAERLFNML